MSSSIKTSPFGGNGGDEFAKQIVQELGLRTGSRVDQIRINGVKHGGGGGDDRGSITLSDNEYINKVRIRSGSEVDYVEFFTNKNNSIGGGGDGGNPTLLENIRVMAIGGRSGSRVDKLNIEYISDYKPSTVVAENVGFILSYTSQSQELFEYEDRHEKTVDSYEKITESMLNQTYTASVEGEYYVKVAASTQIEIKSSTLETVRQELQQELSSGSHKTITIKDGYVGVLLVNGTLMKSADGDEHWMFPTTDVSYSVIKIEDIKNVQNHYDLTGELYTQMPGLIDYRVIQNGYTFYKY
jgi:Jacalin-like lectin domain